MKYTPTINQYQFAKSIITKNKVFGILDLGEGKTAATLNALNTLFKNKLTKGVLIIAPLEVMKLTWPDEIEQWDQFSWMTFSKIHGNSTNRYIALGQRTNIFLINYENLIWLSKVLAATNVEDWPFDSVIFDESSKMKAFNTKRFRGFAKLSHHFKYVVHLTGTPRPNSELDLWSQTFLLDNGHSLGKNFYVFRSKYAFSVDKEARVFKLYEGMGERIYSQIKHLIYTTPNHLKKEKVPATFETIKLGLDPKSKNTYKILEKEGLLTVKEEEQSFIAIAKLGKCKQFTGGAVFHGLNEEGKYSKEYDIFHEIKIKALIALCKKLPNAIITYEYKHEKERILKALPGSTAFTGDTSTMLKNWNSGKIKYLLCHPASKSMGLNLQHGGHNIIWYGITWSYEQYYQMIGRLRRTGQKNNVGVYHLIVENSVDELILEVLRYKEEGSTFFYKCLQTYISK